ncbi:MAG: molybdopterin-dependent oxidoreductase, partial [bacterium]|nr:molybdopterin-dependent oxidoreductase [bacterium]
MVIDSRESEAAKDADLFFQVKTGSDTALAMGVCRILIEKGWVDHDFIEKETTGFDKWKEAVLQWSPAQVETATGLKWSDVETIARAYKDSPQSATVIGIGLQKNTHGADQVRAVSFIPTLRGLHRGFSYSNSDAYFIDSATINGEVFRKEEPKIVPLVAVGDYIRRGEFKFIFVSGMNPLLTLPDQNALREGFAREDVFVVTHETHWTETCDYSDIVLPAPTFLEKQDIIVPWTHKHFRLSQQVIPAVGESRPEVYVMQQLAHRLKIKAPWVWENPWDVMKKAFDTAFEKGSFKDLMDGNDMVLKCKPANRYPTSSGKMEFYSGEAAGKGFTPLPVHRDLVFGEGEFILLNSATRN